MNLFKALIKKEFWVSKKILVMPIWITIVFYAIILISIIVNFIQHGTLDINMQMHNQSQLDVVLGIYIMNLVATMFPGFMLIITGVIASECSLNDDAKYHCEILHHAQPVSPWTISLIKITNNIGSTLIIGLGLMIINFLVMNLTAAYFVNVDWNYAMIGFSQGLVFIILAHIFISSFSYFWGSIFKEKAVLKALLIIIATQVLISVLNSINNWHLISPFTFLFKNVLPSATMDFNVHAMNSKIVNLDQLRDIVLTVWNDILSWKVIVNLMVSTAFLSCATYLYKNRELS